MTNQKKNVRDIILSRVNDVLSDKTLKFNKAQIEAIQAALAPQRGGSAHVKENEDGLVYCNYFKDYLSPELFKKTPQDKWPPMSIEGTKRRQKHLTLDKQMNKEISEAFLKEEDIDKSALVKKYEKLHKEVDTVK